jgi:hypothetical protein
MINLNTYLYFFLKKVIINQINYNQYCIAFIIKFKGNLHYNITIIFTITIKVV